MSPLLFILSFFGCSPEGCRPINPEFPKTLESVTVDADNGILNCYEPENSHYRDVDCYVVEDKKLVHIHDKTIKHVPEYKGLWKYR